MATAALLQKAIYDALVAALTASAVPVYDSVPDATEPAYVVVGEADEEEWDTDTSVGREVRLLVHTWSRYTGMKQVKDIMDTIKATLHNVSLSVAGQVVVLVLLEYSEARLDADGLTRHGVQRFVVLMEGD